MKVVITRFYLLFSMGVVLAVSACASQTYEPEAAASVPEGITSVELKSYPPSKEVMEVMESVANWQLPRLLKADYVRKDKRERSEDPTQWIQAAFYTGLMKIAERSDNTSYEKWIGMIGRDVNWQLGERLFHADDHIAGQPYIWYYLNYDDSKNIIQPTIDQFDKIIDANLKTDLTYVSKRDRAPGVASCSKRWCWADALYMAPPTFFALSRATGEKKYADFAHKEFTATMDFLYSPKYQLVYRDSRFIEKTGRVGQFGEVIFWSRGMGWVMGGLVNSMDQLDKNDPRRKYYEDYFVVMAKKLKTLQRKDGTWAASLLAIDETPLPETSGTAFFTYAFAWGIKNGLLEKAEFWPTTSRAWTALNSAVHPDGKLGWVQQVGFAPGETSYHGTQMYGSGAFLLAGSMIYDLAKQSER